MASYKEAFKDPCFPPRPFYGMELHYAQYSFIYLFILLLNDSSPPPQPTVSVTILERDVTC